MIDEYRYNMIPFFNSLLNASHYHSNAKTLERSLSLFTGSDQQNYTNYNLFLSRLIFSNLK